MASPPRHWGNDSSYGIWTFQSGVHWTPTNVRPANLNELVPGACAAPTFDPANCVNIGGDYNLDGLANQRPNEIANHVNASHDQWANGFNCRRTSSLHPAWAGSAILAATRSSGPGTRLPTYRCLRTFRLSDRLNLQFRVEAFNVFNHTNFALAFSSGSAHNEVSRAQFGEAADTIEAQLLNRTK